MDQRDKKQLDDLRSMRDASRYRVVTIEKKKKRKRCA